MRKKQKKPWKPILFASLSSPERSTNQEFCSQVGLHTEHRGHSHRDAFKCAEIQTLKLSRLGTMSEQTVQKVEKGRPPWHWDIRCAYLFFFLSFVPWVYRNKENRHRKEVMQYFVRSLFSKNLFSFSLLLVETDQMLVCIKSIQPQQC